MKHSLLALVGNRTFQLWTVGAAILATGFLLLAFLGPKDDASVNAATEVFGVVLGTYFTVGLIELLRRRRERVEADARLRRRLTSELTANLSLMVARFHDSAHARHQMLSGVRESMNLQSRSDPKAQIPISQQQRDHLVLGLAPQLDRDRLQAGALADAIGTGAFLEVAPDGSTTASQLHETLATLLSDIRGLPVGTETALGDWLAGLLAELWPRRGPYEVTWYFLVQALSYYDDVTNIFNGHVLAIRQLHGITRADVSRLRRPSTPFGTAMEQDLRAERVSPDEIEKLVKRGIFPFGAGYSRGAVSAVASGLGKRIIQDMVDEFVAAGIPRDEISVTELESMAEKTIRENLGIMPEGIEILRRSDDR